MTKLQSYYDWLNEGTVNFDESFKIKVLSYDDFCLLPETYELAGDKKEDMKKYIDIIKNKHADMGDPKNKFHFIAAIKDNKQVYGFFYKQMKHSSDKLDIGFMIGSEGVGKYMFRAMRKLGPFTSFAKITNFTSLNIQMNNGAEIICITDSSPDKNNKVD